MMSKILVILYAIIFVVGIVGVAAADGVVFNINFDDPAFSNGGQIPSNYMGFNWGTDFYVEPNSDYMGNNSYYGNTYGAPSGPNAVFNNSGMLTLTLAFPGAQYSQFDFVGAYFTGWAYNDAPWEFNSGTITVTGYKNKVLINSVSMDLPTDSYKWLQADLLDIDTLVFTSSVDGKFWLMDNLIIHDPEPYNVPEPATIFLLGSGLLSVGWLMRKRRA
jgi:hypothetical protein